MVDENGNQPPSTLHADHRFDPKGKYFLLTIGTYGLAIPVVGVAALAHYVKRINARRRAVREIEEVPLISCADSFTEGTVRIRGEVSVIEPVEARPDELCAAFVRRDYLHQGVEAQSAVIGSGACGRFLVRDDTGAALVDDDFFEIFGEDGKPPHATKPYELIVRDGDLVEVVGPARRVPTQSSAPTSFREPSTQIVFNGTSEALIRIIKQP